MASIREITERGIDAFNRHDGALLEELCATDIVCTAPGEMTFNGPAQVRQFMESWFAAFPDARTTTRQVQYAGDSASVEEGVFEGTQDGVFATPQGDIPPTHRRVRGEYANIITLRGDKIVSQHLYFDRLQLLEQLGLVPTPAATGTT
jgi:ketosteroid isomerase-like protein